MFVSVTARVHLDVQGTIQHKFYDFMTLRKMKDIPTRLCGTVFYLVGVARCLARACETQVVCLNTSRCCSVGAFLVRALFVADPIGFPTPEDHIGLPSAGVWQAGILRRR